jgi:hypothetical protein
MSGRDVTITALYVCKIPLSKLQNCLLKPVSIALCVYHVCCVITSCVRQELHAVHVLYHWLHA